MFRDVIVERLEGCRSPWLFVGCLSMGESAKILNRYTTLPVLVDALTHKRLTLLSPKTWEDRNDSFYIDEYRRKKKLKSVLAICFTMSRETFHHWKIFSNGTAGVCIEFDKERLEGSLKTKRGFIGRDVDYRTIEHVEQKAPDISDWPFLKRHAFKAEHEFRIIFENLEPLRTKSLSFEIEWVDKVTLSPWMPKDFEEATIALIKNIAGCELLTVHRSTLLENERWKAAVKNWVDPSKPRSTGFFDLS